MTFEIHGKLISFEELEPILKQWRDESKGKKQVSSTYKEEDINSLPPNLAEPLRLQSKGMTYREISEVLGITMGAVKSRFHCAKKAILNKKK